MTWTWLELGKNKSKDNFDKKALKLEKVTFLFQLITNDQMLLLVAFHLGLKKISWSWHMSGMFVWLVV